MAVILITDDDPRNRELIAAYLRRSRHRLVLAASGREALAVAEEDSPDLAIVDLDMPELDGQKTMRLLKHQSAGEYLPVILVVPFGDLDTRLGAWQAGADEVMLKPVHRDELLVRTENLLQLRAERLAMARSNRELLRLQEFKSNLDQLLVHDLKNPLAALSANLEYLGQEVAASFEPDVVEAVGDALGASRRLQRMVASILDVSGFEEGVLQPKRTRVPLAPLLSGLQRLHRHAADERGVAVEVECPGDLELEVDRELFTRVIENLLETALRRTGRGGLITLRGQRRGESTVRLVVATSGQPIPDDMRGRLFEKYGALAMREGEQRVGVGLGLYFCRLAVEAHGGRIFLDDGDRVDFVIELPAVAGNR